MKKFLLISLLFTAFSTASVFADSVFFNNSELVKIQNKVVSTGFKILNANNIDKKMTFYFDSSKNVVNAYTSSRDRSIVVYRGVFNMLDSEDELAAVLAHEISHGVDSYDGIFRGFFEPVSHFSAPKKYEYKADKRAVDYMVKAGYNPIAFIVMINKIGSQTRYERCHSHPLTTRRMMAVYEYIYRKYPQYLVNNAYIENIYYQNFLITSRENRKKFEAKVKKQANEKVNYL